MRKRSVFQSLLAAVVLFTACSEEKVEPDFHPEAGQGTITFTLPGLGQKVVSYAGIADDSEKQLSEMSIYMFSDESGLLDKVFRFKEITIGGSGSDRTASINVTGLSGKRDFYFVGNGDGHSEELADIQVGVTRKADFVEAITDKHPEELSRPLLMSGKTTIADVSSPTPAELKVNLLRRVARLDIENNPTVSNFKVKKILVSNAKLRGYVFGDATATPEKTIETGNYDAIEITPKDAENPVRMDSVFYLFPTKIDAGATEIAVEGTFLGATRVYNLKTPSGGIDLLANNRYILKIKKVDINSADMELTIADWTDSDEYNVEPETNLLTFSTETEGGDGIVISGNDVDIRHMTTEATLTLTVESFGSAGTDYVITGNTDDLPGFTVNASEPVLTYGASYIQKYTIVIPERDERLLPVEITIDIINLANSEQQHSIRIHSLNYPGTRELPVVFGGKTWAPVNVGATKVGPAKLLEHDGLHYQWGRSNIGFEPWKVDDIVRVSVGYEEATTGIRKNSYLIGDKENDWLTPQDHTLWSGDDRQGPCPDGWHVSTLEELQLLVTAFGTGYDSNGGILTKDDENMWIAVKGDNETDFLYFPYSGGSSYASNGVLWYEWGLAGYYWSSGVKDTKAMILRFGKSYLLRINEQVRDIAASVRCIKD